MPVMETLVVPKVSRATFFRLVGQYAKGRYRDYPDLIWQKIVAGAQGHVGDGGVGVPRRAVHHLVEGAVPAAGIDTYLVPHPGSLQGHTPGVAGGAPPSLPKACPSATAWCGSWPR